MGESKNRVHNVGSLGVEAIKKTKLMSKKELQEELNIIFKGKVALVSYHPETLEKSKNTKNFDNFLNSLKKLRNFTFIFTMPNADLGYKYIVNKFKKFVKKNHNSIFVKSLGHRKYFSLCKYSDIVIGNSSSGIIEIPSFKKPTLNVGSRQDGRLKSGSIIDCSHNTNEILKKVTLAFSKKFYKKIKKIKNPYFNGNTSKKIKNIIKKTNFKNLIFKKFIDIKY